MGKEYRTHDHRVWEKIFSGVPEEWFEAPASDAMKQCLEFFHGTRPRRTVDIGCGIGRWGMFLANNGVSPVIQVDYSVKGLKAARAWADRERVESLTFLAADALRLPFRQAAFDGVVAALLLDNLDREDAATAMREINRVAGAGAAGFFLFNPRFAPDQLAELQSSDNPTRNCMHVVYRDAEIEQLLDGWAITRRALSKEGFRGVQAERLG